MAVHYIKEILEEFALWAASSWRCTVAQLKRDLLHELEARFAEQCPDRRGTNTVDFARPPRRVSSWRKMRWARRPVSGPIIVADKKCPPGGARASPRRARPPDSECG